MVLGKTKKDTTHNPGLFFWVIGPLLLLFVSIFISNPHCISEPILGCTKNWVINQDTLVYAEVDPVWSRYARVASFYTLLIVYTSLLLNFICKETRVKAGQAISMVITLLIISPGALVIFSHSLGKKEDLYHTSGPISESYGRVFNLHTLFKESSAKLFLTQHRSKSFLTSTEEILSSKSINSNTKAKFIFDPRKDERKTNSLTLSSDKNFILLLSGPNQLILAYDLLNERILKKNTFDSISPFILIGEHQEISQTQISRLKSFLEPVKGSPEERQAKGLPSAQNIIDNIGHKNPSIRFASIDLLNLYPEVYALALHHLAEQIFKNNTPEVRSIASKAFFSITNGAWPSLFGNYLNYLSRKDLLLF